MFLAATLTMMWWCCPTLDTVQQKQVVQYGAEKQLKSEAPHHSSNLVTTASSLQLAR